MSRLLILVMILFLQGCTIFEPQLKAVKNLFFKEPVTFPKFDNYLKARNDPEKDDSMLMTAATQDFYDAVKFCNEKMENSQYYGRQAAQNRLGLGSIGALAGGVIAPSLAAGGAAKSAIAGWSGLSGVTNSLMIDFDKSPLSHEAYFQERREVARELKANILSAARAETAQAKVDASITLASMCEAAGVTGAAQEAPIDTIKYPKAPADIAKSKTEVAKAAELAAKEADEELRQAIIKVDAANLAAANAKNAAAAEAAEQAKVALDASKVAAKKAADAAKLVQ